MGSADRDEAAERLRSLLDIPDDVPPSWFSTCRWRGSPGTNGRDRGEVARLRNLVDEGRS